MGTIQKLTIVGGALGSGAGLFLLGRGAAASLTLEGVVPGLLTLAFAAIGGWGGFLFADNPKAALRAVLGAVVGGLIIAGWRFFPAALPLLFAAYLGRAR